MTTPESPVFFREFDLNKERRRGVSKDPFPHQRKALDELQKWFRSAPKSNAGGIVVLPTGGGKTFTAIRFLCSTVLSQGYKVLWLAHTHHLLEQAFGEFEKSVGKIAEPKRTLACRVVSGTTGHYKVHEIKATDDVVVATLQTMTGAHERSHPKLIEFLRSSEGRLCVVFDEAHHAPAPSYRKLIKQFRSEHDKMLLIGLTATPTYTNPSKQGWLKELFPQGIVHQSPAKELMADEILARPIFEKVPTKFTPEFDEDEYAKWVETYRDIPEDIISALAKKEDRNRAIASQFVANKDRYGKTIIFADRWYQCERIASFLNAQNVRADSVYSHVDAQPATAEGRNARRTTENASIIEKFKNGELDVLINVQMLTEGTDVPLTQTVFITRQTTSSVLLTQMVGRALRGPKAGGTKEAYIVSFEDEWKQRINWAEFDQLTEGEISEREIVKNPAVPMRLISIDLLRRLVSQMDSSVNQTPAPFLKLMPIGWFRAEIQTLVEGTEDVEWIRPLIMVFDDQQEGFSNYLEFIESEDLSDLSSERIKIEEVRPLLEEWLARFFPGSGDMIGTVDLKDLFYLARHFAQNQARPTWFPFEERIRYNLDDIARKILNDDLKQSELNDRLHSEYENPAKYWKTLYPSYIHFKTQFDACFNRLQSSVPEPIINPPPPVDPPFPPEPPEETKRQVLIRDRHACLCCGETKKSRLQIDHIESRYMGGNHAMDNLQTLCKECNSQKRTDHADFRKHHNKHRFEPPKSFPSLRVKDSTSVGDPDYWSRTLRRAVNLFYGAAAVGDVKIGKKGPSFYDWSIQLLGENDARWLEPHIRQILAEVRRARTQAGKTGPDGIRVEGGGYKADHFENQPADERSPHFRHVPDGTQCRLTLDGKSYEGIILRGVLKVGSRAPYSSFSAAFKDLVGRSGRALKLWEVRSPGSSEWSAAEDFIARVQVEIGE